jgi:exopolysaccharide biosynthesis polyprenyl glycosylphosphotransferase
VIRAALQRARDRGPGGAEPAPAPEFNGPLDEHRNEHRIPHAGPATDASRRGAPSASRLIDLSERSAGATLASVPPAPEKGYRGTLRWERHLVGVVVAVDLTAILLSCAVAFLVRSGATVIGLRFAAMTAGLAAAWLCAMWLSRAYEARYLTLGSEEFKRACNAALRLIAFIATVSYATEFTTGRGFVVIALPLATVLDLLGRYGARKAVLLLRRRGRCLYRVVAAGSTQGVADLVRSTRRAPYAGMNVVGCCVDQRGPMRISAVEDVPVLGDLTSIAEAVRAAEATTVAVAARGEVSAQALRRLSWDLEGTGVDMLVAPALTDVAGPRIHIRPVAGLPLLHVEEPELSGGRRLLKTAFDRTVAAAVLLLLLPVMLTLGLAVRLTTPGPMLFRQTRCGRAGRPFTIYKYRSMRVDAEAQLQTLLSENDRADGLLFKIRRDPRITTVGRWLRRYSLDELPQLLNVAKGDMSLVGPRPPLPSEVAQYESEVHRRLLVKPGLTGLWQVSGRSDLTWEESVRLDLEYVENWSLALDFMILWKTAFAVMKAEGAY